ncbi:hypothetical protein Fcan01_02967 [Folsomia candida]|uniref:Uncharacterized protein n=2 Tax=Folsomia candida TaxID=158441 RepID=A0A226EX23_FOLCA|nr:hypothetical protein Fcan01_02967 [Folsomia candida]
MTGERVQVDGRPNGVEGGSRRRRSSLDSCDCDSVGLNGQPSSKVLLVKLANDYSAYLQTDLSLQITKVEEFILENIAKLEEFQSLYEMKEGERKAWATHLPDIIRTGSLLSITLNQRLDALSCLILSIKCALDKLEGEISQTEMKLGLSPHNTSTAIRSVFKYFYKAGETGSDHSLPRNKSDKASSLVSYQQLRGPDPLHLAQFFH